MKTFRELISWELEQEKKGNRSLQLTTGKLSSNVLRKLRYLSNVSATGGRTVNHGLKPF